MFGIDKLEKLQKYIDKHEVPIDPMAERGATGGGLSSTCQGFLPQPDGSVIRIKEELPNDAPGPGKYDPYFPTFLSKTFKFVKPVEHVQKDQTSPSPCDYTRLPKSTKIPHILHPTDPYPLDPTPLSGDLDHPDWTPKAPSLFPTNRFPSKEFKTDIRTNDFYSVTERTLFPEIEVVERNPSPDRYNPKKGMSDFDKEECSSSIFKSEYVRFPPSTTIVPSPDAYTLPEVFGNSNTKEIVPPNEKIEYLSNMLKKREISPEPLQYAPNIIEKPKNLQRPSPFFKSKSLRDPEPAFLTPGANKYNIDRESKVRACDIRARIRQPGSEWSETSIKDTPTCTAYNVPLDDTRNKGGYISHIGHRAYDSTPDYPLGFRSTHSSLIKPSYNIHYRNVMKFNKVLPRSSLSTAISTKSKTSAKEENTERASTSVSRKSTAIN